MKLGSATLILALAVASDLALRPFCGWSVAHPDPALLVLIYLARRSDRARVHLLGIVLAVARTRGGLDTPLEAWFPIAVTLEWTCFIRARVRLRDPWARGLVLPAGLVVFTLTLRWLQGLPHSELWWHCGVATLLAALWGMVLFPILDALEPLLHDPRR